ncbi:MAG: hypothetical protein JOZ73_03420 [Solirubrobacterales bacterium]|nr:hypothetical protein [Solirubrobacterales bacterium]
MDKGHRKKLSIAGALVALAAFGGGAYAATQSNTNPRQAYLSDVAKRLGTSPQQLNQALEQALFDRLNAAVAAGKLTKAQADAIKRRIEQSGGLPLGGLGFLGHREHGAFGGPGARGGLLTAAAKYLGLSQAQLMSELSAGHSLAQIAHQRNKSTSGLQNAMLASAKTRLDRAAAAKRLTSAQETQLLNRLKTRISRLIQTAPPRGMRPGWPHPGGLPGRSGAFPGPPGGGAADFGGPPPPDGAAPAGPGGAAPAGPGPGV